MPRTCLADKPYTGNNDIVQRLFLLGTVLYDGQPQKIQDRAGGNEHMARLHGEHGFRLQAGHRPSRGEARTDTECRILRQRLQGVLERNDDNKHLDRTGRGEPHTTANSQSRRNDSQPGIFLHPARGEEGERHAPRQEVYGAPLHKGEQEGIRICGNRHARGSDKRNLPRSQPQRL